MSATATSQSERVFTCQVNSFELSFAQQGAKNKLLWMLEEPGELGHSSPDASGARSSSPDASGARTAPPSIDLLSIAEPDLRPHYRTHLAFVRELSAIKLLLRLGRS